MATTIEVGATLIKLTNDGELAWKFYAGIYNLNHGDFFYHIYLTDPPSLSVNNVPFSSENWVGDLVAAIKAKSADVADAVLASLV